MAEKRRNGPQNTNKNAKSTSLRDQLRKYISFEYGKEILINPEKMYIISTFLLVVEIFINAFIILYRPYTEIDWEAYMEEVGGFLNGTLDYQYLKGGTGPLVYPAGFVYIFSLLFFATGKGQNIFLAQWIFGIFYIGIMYQVHRLYSRSIKIPPYVLLFMTFTSYRVHSIFVLRLFNDPIAMLFLYISLNAFMDGKWTLGSLTYSLAVSMKMNVLLYAPGLLVVYLTQLSLFDAVVQLAVCGVLQVVLALPFLLVNPWSYLSRSFDLGRVFLYEWTVNWKLISEELFLNRYFHLLLLSLHIVLLLIFLPSWIRYLKAYSKIGQLAENGGREEKLGYVLKMRNQLFLFPLFVSNFIGIVFSRSLHYQFYVWYYHTLPYLLWSTKYSVRLKLCLFGIIELCWNVFPATPASSSALLISHLFILGGLWKYTRQQGPDTKLTSHIKTN